MADEEKLKKHLDAAWDWVESGLAEIGKARDLLNGNPSPKKIETFEIQGRDFIINGERKYLVGVSWRQFLQMVAGERPWENEAGFETPQEYINAIVDNGLNYVRHNICFNAELVKSHCEEMRENGVVVELTLHDEGKPLGNAHDVVAKTKHLPNVIYEGHNEFRGDGNIDDCNIAWWWSNFCLNNGLLSSGGAYGAGGQAWANKFWSGNPTNKIVTVHRDWDCDSIKRHESRMKPIVRNEFFNMTSEDTKARMLEDFDCGASGVNYYGDWFLVAGDVCRMKNGE